MKRGLNAVRCDHAANKIINQLGQRLSALRDLPHHGKHVIKVATLEGVDNKRLSGKHWDREPLLTPAPSATSLVVKPAQPRSPRTRGPARTMASTVARERVLLLYRWSRRCQASSAGHSQGTGDRPAAERDILPRPLASRAAALDTSVVACQNAGIASAVCHSEVCSGAASRCAAPSRWNRGHSQELVAYHA